MIETMNASAFVAGIDEVEKDLLSTFEREMEAEAAELARRFRFEDLSGRKPDDTGLNKRTGRLFDSVDSEAYLMDAEVVASVFNEGAPYWYYHEVGAGHNPKRLDFFRRFEVEGTELFMEAGAQAAEEAFS